VIIASWKEGSDSRSTLLKGFRPLKAGGLKRGEDVITATIKEQ
jgi:hypothetical protein